MRPSAAAVLVILLALQGDLAQASADVGERAFLHCYSCHSIEPGETEGLQGPNLAGVVGRPIATQPGYEYSAAMREFAAEHGRWDAALLERFIAAPEKVVPGTEMAGYPGLADADARTALIEYLKSR